MHDICAALDGEVIYAARTYRRGGLAAQNQTLRQLGVGIRILRHLIVEARDIEQGGKSVLYDRVVVVHTARYGARRVFAVADVAQPCRNLVSVGRPLRGDLVADAPHHNRGVVAEVVQHVDHVALGPLVEEAVVAVLAFGHVPLVEGLDHHHESHLVAQLDKLRVGHVVRGAYGVAPHILEQGELTSQRRPVHRGAQRAEVVVQTHAAELAHASVEEESLVGAQLYGAYAEACGIAVDVAAFVVDIGLGRIEFGRLGRPQARVLDSEVLLGRHPVVEFLGVVFHRHLASRRVAYACDKTHLSSVGNTIDIGTQMYRRVILGYVRCGDVCAPDRYMHLICRYEMDVAVEARSRIPAR